MKIALHVVRIGLGALALVTGVAAQEARFFRMAGPAPTVITAFTPDGYITWLTLQPGANYTVQTAPCLTGPSNWVDYVQVPTFNWFTTNRLYDPNPPSGMVLIPAGSFTMGNCMDSGEGFSSELPLHTVYVSGFYMDTNLVTSNLWQMVTAWNGGNGYSYTYAGSGKASGHPVQYIDWYDCVKWCNARSQMESLTPCYYRDPGFSTVYKVGQVEPYVKWGANGYRLPTEAEWEKAARGGLSGHRFPWGDLITQTNANYYVVQGNGRNYYAYDQGATPGYHPGFNDGVMPYTSPVGCFAANGYGLYDRAGNVWQWCWDCYLGAYYSSSPGSDPRGPDSGADRVLRGGSWLNDARLTRCAFRYSSYPNYTYNYRGFRCVRGL
jgi:formylglycine-generating enzyme required for sulfatase activity